ncbi:Hypothetical predicted protein [Paramuricea clavata]|uniref:Uncharacterized protein n=1 Tax=Paramuricea clavata TaxID=317549 RepID=A0A6S7GYY5_PARCT|nr:Hypothetical predicted protein [Paramuricea clavata]
MARAESCPKKQFTFEPLEKKKIKHHDDEQPKVTKETLLKVLADIEDEIGELKQGNLEKKLKDLREQVNVLLQRHEEEFKRLCAEINDLKEEVEMLKAKNNELSDENKRLVNKLAVAQVTWLWEAHLVRFVVHPSKQIFQFDRFNQMRLYLKRVKKKDNLWTKIQNNIGSWTRKHWKMVNTVRKERNGVAHPDIIDLDLVESELTKMPLYFRDPMRHMMDILKTTASLMKFGRLAEFFKTNKHLFPTEEARGKGMDARALKDIHSWDRKFEEIDGLQNIQHEEAKRYLAKYVSDSRMINQYYFIVDFIKDGNRKRLGKLAWKFEKCYSFTSMSTQESEALNELKKLLSKPEDESNVADLIIAKLHIPDFLPKHLWKHGIKIVEKYFKGR